ncbi:TLC domain-containing protein 3A-like [Diadema setosum]|uniref:TLC domain-containing protein 3A-like n=1 Tax=Diadema setosum TaxID=31175 RepID=UPI003B3A19E8
MEAPGETPWYIMPNFFAGCVFWPSMFHLTWYLFERSGKFTETQSCGTAMRLVSVIHAVMASMVGTISVANTYKDIIYDDHWLLNFFAAFAYSYMPYDTYAMFHVHIREKNLKEAPFSKQLTAFLKGLKLEVFHHAISTFLGYPIILRYRHNKGTFIVGCVYITEYSTPFVNFRKILIRNGYGSSLAFVINNIIVLITFFVVRVALWPTMYVVYAINKELTFKQVVTSMPRGCHIAMVIVMILQTSWFVLFARGFFKTLVSPKKKLKKEEPMAAGEANGYVDVNGKKVD